MKTYDVFLSYYQKSEYGNNKCFDTRRVTSLNEQEAIEDAEKKFKQDNPFNVSQINVYDIERYVEPR